MSLNIETAHASPQFRTALYGFQSGRPLWQGASPLGVLTRYHKSVRLLPILLVLAALPLAAQSLVDQGFDHFYNLEYPEAIADFEQAIAQNPTSRTCTITWRRPSFSRRCTATARSKANWSRATTPFCGAPKLNPRPPPEKRFLAEVDQRHVALPRPASSQSQRHRRAVRARASPTGCGPTITGWSRNPGTIRCATPPPRAGCTTASAELEPRTWMPAWCRGCTITLSAACPGRTACWVSWSASTATRRRASALVQDVAQQRQAGPRGRRNFLCALYRRENQPGRAVPLVQDLIRAFPAQLSAAAGAVADVQHGRRQGVCGLEAVEEVARLKRAHAPGYRPRAVGEEFIFRKAPSSSGTATGPGPGEHEEGGRRRRRMWISIPALTPGCASARSTT